MFSAIEQLATGAFEGREQHLSSGEVVRTWLVHPLRLHYERSHGDLEVLRVYHHAREPIAK